ncbi:MAG: hypothetical protein ACQESR_25950, partial [Planctomycetota bacterium]
MNSNFVAPSEPLDTNNGPRTDGGRAPADEETSSRGNKQLYSLLFPRLQRSGAIILQTYPLDSRAVKRQYRGLGERREAVIFQAVGFFRVERRPTQAVLPLVGLAAEKVIRDRCISGGRIFPGGTLPDASRPPVGRTRGGESHPRPVYFRRSDFSGWNAARRKPSSRWSDSRRRKSSATGVFQAVGFFRVER